MNPIDPQGCDESRRSFITKAVYITPLILSLKADPSFASSGSGSQSLSRPPKGNNGVGNGEDPAPPGNPPLNDGPGTGPGHPGNTGAPGLSGTSGNRGRGRP
jgi:hypothetical protein